MNNPFRIKKHASLVKCRKISRKWQKRQLQNFTTAQVSCLMVNRYHDIRSVTQRAWRTTEAVDMNGRFQMQGGKNWFLPKEMNANRFFWDSHWLEIWSNHFYPSMGPNGGSVAMDSVKIRKSMDLLKFAAMSGETPERMGSLLLTLKWHFHGHRSMDALSEVKSVLCTSKSRHTAYFFIIRNSLIFYLRNPKV
jgi:hypothetical protein